MEFTKKKLEEAKQAGAVISHDVAEPGENEKGQRMSNLPYRSGDFPAVKTDQGSANGYPQPVEQSPLESSLPKLVSASDIAQQSGAFWRGSGKQGSL